MSWGRCPRFLLRKLPEPTIKDGKEAALAALETCLIEYPEQWEQKTHELVHAKSKVTIWTANEDYALHISGPNWKLEKDSIPQHWRERIYSATKKEQRAYRQLVADLAKGFGTPLQIEDSRK